MPFHSEKVTPTKDDMALYKVLFKRFRKRRQRYDWSPLIAGEIRTIALGLFIQTEGTCSDNEISTALTWAADVKRRALELAEVIADRRRVCHVYGSGAPGLTYEREPERRDEAVDLDALDRDDLKKFIKDEGLGTLADLGINKATSDDEIRQIIVAAVSGERP